MTGAPLLLFSSARLTRWERVGQVVRETAALGVNFRISGSCVAIDAPAELPPKLNAELGELRASGLLRRFLLSGDDPDRAAFAFADSLGVQRVLVTTRDGVREAVRQLSADLRQYGGHLGLDIETGPRPGQGKPRPYIQLNADGTPAERQPPWKDDTGLDPHRANIICLQLYAGGRCAYVFRGEALHRVLHLRWLRRQHIVAHNATFECAFLLYHAGRKPPRYRRNGGRLDCTSQAMGLLRGVGYGGSGRRLDKAAAAFLGLAVPKDLQLSDWSAAELSEGQIGYAAADAILAWRLWPPMRAELKRQRREPSGRQWSRWGAYELQRRAIPAVADMELRGLGFDRDEHARQAQAWAAALAHARHTYQELTGEPPPAKQADKQAWLRQVLAEHPEHFPSWPRTTTGLLSTRAGQLKRLIGIDTVRAMLAISANEQLLNNFGPRLAERISPVTGRLHGRYNIAATKAGRFSASAPNLQQLPAKRAPEFKACVVARPGYVLIGCDWSQIEMRAAAWLYRDPVLTQIFIDGRDIHKETAARIAGIPVADVTDAQRDAAKPINYGAIYGQGAVGLRESAFVNYGVELSLAEAEHAQKRFFDAYRQLRKGLWDNYHLCKARGFILIGAGRVVEANWETDVGGRILFTRACNLPIQGAAADAMLRAVAWIYARLKAIGTRGGLVACVHDELLLEVDEDDAEKARQILEQTMLDAFTETFPRAPADGVAKAVIGRTWKEVKHPNT
jgi:DNA polymerase I-like protein with 3'-5' exonuclease and polymerase domains